MTHISDLHHTYGDLHFIVLFTNEVPIFFFPFLLDLPTDGFGDSEGLLPKGILIAVIAVCAILLILLVVGGIVCVRKHCL